MGSFNPAKIANKQKRQEVNLRKKKLKESTRRDERMKRRRLEDKNPQVREERRAKNVPATIDKKRTWDTLAVDEDADGNLGLSFDLVGSKKRRMEAEKEEPLETQARTAEESDDEDLEDKSNVADKDRSDEDKDDLDSFLGSDSEDDADDEDPHAGPPTQIPNRAPSEAPSTATDLNLTPEALVQRYPSLFNGPAADPKVLVTTSINAPIHWEAQLIASIFPNSTYIRRTAHFHSYKYSIREIAAYASSRGYTCVAVLNEERKKPKGLDIVHLPNGPMFHFSISNWVPGSRIPGHGNPTNHFPELILNGFRTPLGLLTAHLFQSLFPQKPEVQGRQVVTLHNQRDYIFFRRHRYVFRDKRGSEKSIQGADGKPMKGVEEIRAGLQELGPRFTLKLRRIDKGIQRASGQDWEWKAHAEKDRTRFSI